MADSGQNAYNDGKCLVTRYAGCLQTPLKLGDRTIIETLV